MSPQAPPGIVQNLEIWLDGERVRSIQLTPGVWTIGRSRLSQIDLPHPRIEARHAELRVEHDSAYLTDLGSANGTIRIDTQPPSPQVIDPFDVHYTPPDVEQRFNPNQPYKLSPGEQFAIGPFRLRYLQSQPEVVSPEETQPPPQLATPGRKAYDYEPPRAPLAVVPEPGVQTAVSRYLYELPVVYHNADGLFLGRYLRIFEHFWERFERRQDFIDYYFDPLSAPARLLPMLAGWLCVDFDSGWPEGRQRAYLKQAADLYRRRGTYDGIRLMIHAITGLTPDIVAEPAKQHVVRVRVRLPADGSVTRELLAELIGKHKPAHLGFELELLP